MTSGAGGERILQSCALKSSQILTCRKHEMQKLWAANIFQSNSKGQRRMSWLIVAQNLSYNSAIIYNISDSELGQKTIQQPNY